MLYHGKNHCLYSDCCACLCLSASGAAVASGIFEVKTGPEVLWYEVAQTTGTQNVPPTPAGGFGSTNGGTLGVMNVQKYVRQ